MFSGLTEEMKCYRNAEESLKEALLTGLLGHAERSWASCPTAGVQGHGGKLTELDLTVSDYPTPGSAQGIKRGVLEQQDNLSKVLCTECTVLLLLVRAAWY